jgi:hypothetical protein
MNYAGKCILQTHVRSGVRYLLNHKFLRGRLYDFRSFAAIPGSVKWNSLPTNEQKAWELLGWDQALWNNRKGNYKRWSLLNSAEQAAVKYGLGYTDAQWDEFVASSVTISNSDPVGTGKALDHRDPGQQTMAAGFAATLAGTAWKGLKIIAPVVKSLSRHALHPGIKLVASGISHLPGFVEDLSPPAEIRGIETILYLDDSGSMASHLSTGQKLLNEMEPILHDTTRIVKFGGHKTVLNGRGDQWSSAITTLGWDASSGSTYMWKMIEDDVVSRYLPSKGDGKLRIVIVTDGCDTDSPPPYRGIRGMDPLMNSLLRKGYDIEWHIVLLDGTDGIFSRRAFSDAEVKRYEALAKATGGSCLHLTDTTKSDHRKTSFLKTLSDSGLSDQTGKNARAKRQTDYKRMVSEKKAENFDWLKLLPPPK